MSRMIALLAGILIATSAALAQTPAAENGRFVLKRVGADLLRLDTRTGQISLCNKGSSGWACMTVPDERAALETEIARLQSELIAVRKRLAEPAEKAPAAPASPRAGEGPRLPSDAELDRAMTVMEKIWRRLIDMVQRTQREFEKKT